LINSRRHKKGRLIDEKKDDWVGFVLVSGGQLKAQAKHLTVNRIMQQTKANALIFLPIFLLFICTFVKA
jgi:hypothetical protein